MGSADEFLEIVIGIGPYEVVPAKGVFDHRFFLVICLWGFFGVRHFKTLSGGRIRPRSTILVSMLLQLILILWESAR